MERMFTQKFILTKKGGKYNFVQGIIWKKNWLYYYLLKGFQKSRNCLKWRYCYLLYNYQSVNEWCTCVCMSLYQYVKVSNWRNMSMNRTYSTSYLNNLMAKIDNFCLLILKFMTNSMTVKYTTWVNTISFFNTCIWFFTLPN